MKNKDNFYLLLIILASNLLIFYSDVGFRPYDTYHYALSAKNIGDGIFHLTPSAIDNRWGVIFPVALLYKIFGMHAWVFILWNIICLDLLLVFVFFIFKKELGNYIFALLIFIAFNQNIISTSAILLTDIPFTCLGAIAVYYLTKVKTSDKAGTGYQGIIFSLLVFATLLARESVIFLLPFFAWIMFRDLIIKKQYRFWIWVTGSAFILGTIYLLGYEILTGDALYRLHGVETEHNLSRNSFFYSPVSEIIRRISYKPFIMLLRFGGFHIFFVISVYVILFCRKYLLSSLNTFNVLFLLISLVVFWFGSTSLQTYNPLPLYARLWMILSVPMTFLMIDFLKLLKRYVQGDAIVLPYFVPYFIFISILSFVLFLTDRSNLSSLLLLFFVLFFVLVYFKISGFLNQKFVPFFMAIFISWTLLFSIKSQGEITYFDERKILDSLVKTNRDITIYSDGVTCKYYPLYFDFKKPGNISFVDFRSITDSSTFLPGSYMMVNLNNIYLLSDVVPMDSLEVYKKFIVNKDLELDKLRAKIYRLK